MRPSTTLDLLDSLLYSCTPVQKSKRLSLNLPAQSTDEKAERSSPCFSHQAPSVVMGQGPFSSWRQPPRLHMPQLT